MNVYRFDIYLLSIRNGQINITDEIAIFQNDLRNMENLIKGIYERHTCDLVNFKITKIWGSEKCQ